MLNILIIILIPFQYGHMLLSYKCQIQLQHVPPPANWFIVIILPIPFYFGHTLLSHERYIQLQVLPPALFENNKNS